jgi:hypothetical protein
MIIPEKPGNAPHGSKMQFISYGGGYSQSNQKINSDIKYL